MMVSMSMDDLLALPVAMDLVTAGKALGIGRTQSYELHRDGAFPVPVLPVGRKLRVTRAALFAYLGMAPDGSALAA